MASLTSTDTTSTYSDGNLNYSTIYYYRVLAVSTAGVSPVGPAVSAETGAQPDALSAQSVNLSLTRQTSFTASVATFTDANVTTVAGRFVATINWGDGSVTVGTISGANGGFTVDGSHDYLKAGTFAIQVTVSMSEPDVASAAATGVSYVNAPPKRVVHRQAHANVHRVTKKKAKAAARRHR